MDCLFQRRRNREYAGITRKEVNAIQTPNCRSFCLDLGRGLRGRPKGLNGSIQWRWQPQMEHLEGSEGLTVPGVVIDWRP
jgi:hypothetical protein